MRLRDGLMLRDDPRFICFCTSCFSVFVSSFHLREKLDHFWTPGRVLAFCLELQLTTLSTWGCRGARTRPLKTCSARLVAFNFGFGTEMMVPVIVLVLMVMMPMLRSRFRCHGTESNLPSRVAHRLQSSIDSVLFGTLLMIYHSAGIPPILPELHIHTKSLLRFVRYLFNGCFLQGTK